MSCYYWNFTDEISFFVNPVTKVIMEAAALEPT